jgi:antitoxin component YwqK of YwqJK toxin-antitoxin module
MEMIPTLKFTKFLLILFLLSCGSNKQEHKLYYPNGEIRVLGTYLDGKAHGFWEGYYPNGQLKTSGNYHKGKLIGHWIWYYQDGTIVKDSIYNYPNSFE